MASCVCHKITHVFQVMHAMGASEVKIPDNLPLSFMHPTTGVCTNSVTFIVVSISPFAVPDILYIAVDPGNQYPGSSDFSADRLWQV